MGKTPRKAYIDSEDKETIKNFLFSTALYGVLLNLIILNFNLPFTYYSWIGWGLLVWFIENKVVKWIRSLRWR